MNVTPEASGNTSRALVLFLNDDVNLMDFVVKILREIFSKTEQEAQYVMLTAPRHGSGLCGDYPEDEARRLTTEAIERARQEGFPLQCIVESETKG